jgi:amino acid transporter
MVTLGIGNNSVRNSSLKRGTVLDYHELVSQEPAHTKLDEFSSTAIAGNDILSSCLYVCGFTATFAGFYAPFVFFAVVLVLYLYKHVYIEVVEALPLNGGAYNCLLNATSKTLAAVAGVMTVLSYVATAVISAKTATEYLHTVLTQIPIIGVTAAIIVGFAILTILGVKDSAKVAKAIFIFHLLTLTLFVVLGLVSLINHGPGLLPDAWAKTQILFHEGGSLKMLFLALAASMLGITGFESSANFVEEQKPGVFRKTLRNMLIGVWIFNPLITFIVLATLDLNTIATVKDFVLSESALVVGGHALQYLMVGDAFMVLSGAVLASFVGATGLLYRMTLDHCLPSSVLLPKLKNRNQNANRIIITFGLLCLSILFVTKGVLVSLAGVYTISFLGVMTAFAVGNIVLRETRPDLKRTYKGPILFAIFAALATAAGIIGNILIDPKNVVYFAMYFFPALILVQLMIYRDYVLEALLKYSRVLPPLHKLIHPWFDHVIKPKIILFAHHPHKLYRSLEYILKNETSRNIVIVFCTEETEDTTRLLERFKKYIQTFKEAQVFPKLNLELVVDKEFEFGPEVVKVYAKRYQITRNNVFIGSIHDSHGFNFEDLGGVRIIQ